MWSSMKQNMCNARDSCSGIPTDVVFQCQVKDEEVHEVKAHKYYLSLASPVLKTWLFGSWRENGDVFVVNASVEAFRAMVDHIYLQEISWEMKSFEEILEIAHLADMYDVAGLMQVVKKAVIDKLPICLNTVVEVFHIAEQFSNFSDISQFLENQCIFFLSNVLLNKFQSGRVVDFSGLFTKSELASSAGKIHSMVLEGAPPICSNCEHFECQHGKLVPEEGWATNVRVPPYGCLVTADNSYWTVVGFEFLESAESFFTGDGDEPVLIARATTFSASGKPRLPKDDICDIRIRLKNSWVYFDCRKLGGAVPEVYWPDDVDMYG